MLGSFYSPSRPASKLGFSNSWQRMCFFHKNPRCFQIGRTHTSSSIAPQNFTQVLWVVFFSFFFFFLDGKKLFKYISDTVFQLFHVMTANIHYGFMAFLVSLVFAYFMLNRWLSFNFPWVKYTWGDKNKPTNQAIQRQTVIKHGC